MDKIFHTGMTLVDLKKPFGKLDHTVLLQWMERIGFKESVIKCFKLYLSNRKFFVTLENVFPYAGLSICGVVFHKDLSYDPSPSYKRFNFSEKILFWFKKAQPQWYFWGRYGSRKTKKQHLAAVATTAM